MSDPEIERIMKRKMEEIMKRERNPIIEINEDNFSNIIESSKPILIDFWASWCAPCKYMHPIFERLAHKYAGKMIFAKVNIDTNPAIAERYKVYAIPTFMVLINGKSVDRLVGVSSEEDLSRLVDKYIE